MDDSLRARLVERRLLAQKRSRRQELSRAFRNVSPALRAAGVRFSRLPPAANDRVLGSLTCGPGQDEELDFSRLPEAFTKPWASSEARDVLCGAALADLVPGEAAVAVVWHPSSSGLRIGAADLISQMAPVLDEGNGDTTWIVSATGGRWLIQIGYWSRTVSWTRNVPDPSRR
jgi:hypothetical protein